MNSLLRKPFPVFRLTTSNDGAAYFFRDVRMPDADGMDSTIGELDVVISLSSCYQYFNLLAVVKPDPLIQRPVQMMRIRIPVTGMDVHVDPSEPRRGNGNKHNNFWANCVKRSNKGQSDEENGPVKLYVCEEIHWARSRCEANALKDYVENVWKRGRTERAH